MIPADVRNELIAFGLTEQQLALADRLPPRVSRTVWKMMANWPGRVSLRVAAGLKRIQVFDRAMTIAAQLFTSVFPIIIMGASIFSASLTVDTLGGLNLPKETQDLVDDVVSTSGGGSAFGFIGVLVVLISATSLSRALTRAYDAVWQHGRTRSTIGQAWRWLAAVLVLAISVVLSRFVVKTLEGLPPRDFWSTSLVFAVNTAIAAFLPWMLMARRVRIRSLLPGALLFALALLLTHPLSSRYLPVALHSSALRYGSIGVAFAYLAFLYLVAWGLLATAVIGQVIARDEGSLGRFVRGPSGSSATPDADERAEDSDSTAPG